MLNFRNLTDKNEQKFIYTVNRILKFSTARDCKRIAKIYNAKE